MSVRKRLALAAATAGAGIGLLLGAAPAASACPRAVIAPPAATVLTEHTYTVKVYVLAERPTAARHSLAAHRPHTAPNARQHRTTRHHARRHRTTRHHHARRHHLAARHHAPAAPHRATHASYGGTVHAARPVQPAIWHTGHYSAVRHHRLRHHARHNSGHRLRHHWHHRMARA
jgi:hypothetical protein